MRSPKVRITLDLHPDDHARLTTLKVWNGDVSLAATLRNMIRYEYNALRRLKETAGKDA